LIHQKLNAIIMPVGTGNDETVYSSRENHLAIGLHNILTYCCKGNDVVPSFSGMSC
jgi:hypothetical protein